jgi:peptidoglycan/xylan/chitin deacetylase (PgdA/CDA1 family)
MHFIRHKTIQNRQRTKAFLAVALTSLMAACASAPRQQAPRPEILGKNDYFTIILARPGDSYAAISERYHGTPALAWRIAEYNRNKDIAAGTSIVVPMLDLNVTGVTQAGVQRVPILCYHRFTTGGRPDKLEVTAAQFEEQILFLKKNGYTIVSLADFHEFNKGRKQLPKKSVVITIDDGYRSIYSIAYPIIQRHRIPVTAYIYNDFLGSGAALTWAQIREMQSGGLINFQSHSKSHSKLSEQGRRESKPAHMARIETELAGSRSAISKQTGKPVDYIAYPYGGTDAYVAARAKEAGYANAATVLRGSNPAYAPTFLLRRDMIFGSDTLATFAARLGIRPEQKVQK